MDGKNLVPVLFRQVVKGPVAQDAGVRDYYVHLAVGVQRRLDDRLTALPRVHAMSVGHRFAARRLDLLDNLIGHLAARRAGPVARASEVIDDNLGAARRQEQGMSPA